MSLPSTFSETTINAAFGNVLLTWYIEKLVCCEPSSIQVNSVGCIPVEENA
jgi:hypothetical protein